MKTLSLNQTSQVSGGTEWATVFAVKKVLDDVKKIKAERKRKAAKQAHNLPQGT